MDFDEVIKRRRMIRECNSERQQIPDQIITKLIKNARKAPNAGHTQVQEFIIIKYASTKKKLRKAAVNQGFHIRQKLGSIQSMKSILIESGLILGFYTKIRRRVRKNKWH